MVEFKPGMKKEELLDVAAANGIAADDSMTKTQIIEALNAHNAKETAGKPAEGATEGAENAAGGEGGWYLRPLRKRDYKLAIKRGCDPKKLEEVITLLCNEQPLPEAYRDHALTNSRNYKDMRECHIEPDWLLVYKVVRQTLILKLIRTGSHSDLF